MKSRLGNATLIIIGSMLFYCGQGAVTQMGRGNPDGGKMGDGGPVGSAGADTCCTPPDPDAPTILFDGQLAPTQVSDAEAKRLCFQSLPDAPPNPCCTAVTPSWDISAYHTVVIHMSSCVPGLQVQYKYGGAGFVDGPSPACVGGSMAFTVDPRLGKQIRLNYANRSDASYPDGYVDEQPNTYGICDATAPENITVVGLKY